jgi:hypothetical protein
MTTKLSFHRKITKLSVVLTGKPIEALPEKVIEAFCLWMKYQTSLTTMIEAFTGSSLNR